MGGRGLWKCASDGGSLGGAISTITEAHRATLTVCAPPNTFCHDLTYQGRKACDVRPDCVWCFQIANPSLFECAEIQQAHKFDPKRMACDWAPPPGPGPSPGPAPPPSTCDIPGSFPPGHSPALQAQRPPQQTAAQASIVARVTRDAATHSSAARDAVSGLLQEAQRELAGDRTVPIEIKRMSESELLELLTWEFRRLPLIRRRRR